MKMKTQALALSALCMAMVGCGGSSSSDNGGEADIRFPFDGEITLSGDTDPGATLTAVVTDANGISGSISYVWTSGDTVITSATGSTYVIADSDQGNSISVTATYTDDDNFDESVFASVTIEAAATPATFAGLTATVSNEATEALTGTVTVTDPNTGEATIVALTDAMTTYGTFSITAEGSWSYTLDTSADAVANLTSTDDPLLDSIELESADGTTANLVITITGAEVSGPVTSQVARITDNSTDDTGELRYALPSAQLAGKITVSFLKDLDTLGSDDTIKDAYITLYNTDTSTSGGKAILDLRIQDDNFAIRDQDGIDVMNAFTPGQWQDVEITWEAADDASAPVLNILIDGVAVTSVPYTGSSTAIGGVTHVAFRFADNSRTVTGTYNIDNLFIYSDTAGTALVFSDDFEGYSVDDSLDTDNANSPYNSSTFEAVVAVMEVPGDDSGSGGSGDTSGPGTAGNKYAEIIDTSTDDTGELRYALPAAQLAGKLNVSFLKDLDTLGSDDTIKDAYITLYNTDTSTSGGKAILDLRIQDDNFAIRDQDGIDVMNAFTPGQWQDVEVTWEAADASSAPVLNILIDGVAVTSVPYTGSATAVGGVTHIAFRFADNSRTVTGTFNVDDIKIYSDTAGTALVFEDSFESGYNTGDSLDTDNGSSPYHSATSEAVVAEE
ncbi:VCBS domain-containing protein [Saccharophagus degradans]|uniref:VCBS domain protein n=1 Tax=Saccharophagus degradans (strain 2-40 / ATCC 43961 / DSM 17024) TaxID=203122 RepID=Q21GX1_SACD2|nr:VCBS domain-containing protein [Saccharophagus degradans]ABD82058.1 VCBS domain protein [Saccharophagus degradans 2-40]